MIVADEHEKENSKPEAGLNASFISTLEHNYGADKNCALDGRESWKTLSGLTPRQLSTDWTPQQRQTKRLEHPYGEEEAPRKVNFWKKYYQNIIEFNQNCLRHLNEATY